MTLDCLETRLIAGGLICKQRERPREFKLKYRLKARGLTSLLISQQRVPEEGKGRIRTFALAELLHCRKVRNDDEDGGGDDDDRIHAVARTLENRRGSDDQSG